MDGQKSEKRTNVINEASLLTTWLRQAGDVDFARRSRRAKDGRSLRHERFAVALVQRPRSPSVSYADSFLPEEASHTNDRKAKTVRHPVRMTT